MNLEQFFREHPKVALAFSGGVDSAYLLYTAVKSGAQVRPYYVKTAFQPQFEYEDARRLARELGVELVKLRRLLLLEPPDAPETVFGADAAFVAGDEPEKDMPVSEYDTAESEGRDGT